MAFNRGEVELIMVSSHIFKIKVFFVFSILILSDKFLFSADLKLPVEPRFAELLWNFENHGQPYRIDRDTYGWPGKPNADIRLLQAWSLQSEASNLKIAIIDSQFDLEHPDLQNSFDIKSSWNFITNQGPVQSPIHDEAPHHGTMVAGVIGADGMNAVGITGILRRSRLIPIEAVPTSGNEDDDVIAQAIRYGVNQGAKIINCSFGKYTTSKVIEEAIGWAHKNDVLIVTSAGNDATDIDEKPHWPSSYSLHFDNVMAVASSNRSDSITNDSNFGEGIDIAAPGHEVFTAGNPARSISKYSSFNGTSAAAPHVSGVAALMFSLNTRLKPREVREILVQTADPLENKNGYQARFGRLNAFRALMRVRKQMDINPLTEIARKCDYRAIKKIYLKSSSKIGYRWEISDTPELYQPWQSEDPIYANYRNWVLSQHPGDFRSILQKHIEAGRKILSTIDPQSDLARRIIADEKLVLSIINGFEGKVTSMNCLESIVFREFLQANKNVKSKNEFLALGVQKGSQIVIMGEWEVLKDSENGFSGTSESEELKSQRAKLLSEDWHLTAHYHNHPFNFENEWGDIGGGLAPSDTDLASYRKLDPRLALITNGIETIRFDKNLWTKGAGK